MRGLLEPAGAESREGCPPAGQRELPDWAVAGSPQDCAKIINRCKEEEGLDYIGLASLSLPKEWPVRLEYLQPISDELLPHL